MVQSIKPLHDRIIVKRLECEEKTAGGIYIPDTAKEKAQQGQVIAVGAGKVTKDGNVHALVLNENDIVLFGKYSGTEVNFDGEDYLIMREEDVLAVLSK